LAFSILLKDKLQDKVVTDHCKTC